MARDVLCGFESGDFRQADFGDASGGFKVEYGVTDTNARFGVATIPSPTDISLFGMEPENAKPLQFRLSNLTEMYVRSRVYCKFNGNRTYMFVWTDGTTLERFHVGNQNSDLNIELLSDGSLEVFRDNRNGGGGTLIASSAAGVIVGNTHHRVEVWFKVANSGGRVVVRIDDVEVIDFTGDTQGAQNTSGYMNTFAICSQMNYLGSEHRILHDDVVVNGVSGTINNSWLGDTSILRLAPIGMGSSTDLAGTPEATNRYENIDEVPPSITEYNSDSVVDEYDLYTFEQLDAITTVHAAAAYAFSQYPATASTFKFVAKPDASEFRSAAKSPTIGGTYGPSPAAGPWFRPNVYSVNPDGDIAWTAAAINSLEAGFEVATAQEIRLGNFFLEVDVSTPESCALLPSDGLFLVDASTGDVSVSLSLAEIYGQVFYIKRIDESAFTVTIDPSPLTIDGLVSMTLGPLDAITIVTDGIQWYLL